MAVNNALLEAGNALRNLEQLLGQQGLSVDDRLPTYLNEAAAALPRLPNGHRT